MTPWIASRRALEQAPQAPPPPPPPPVRLPPHRSNHYASVLTHPHQARDLRLRDAERVTRCGAELLSRHARKLDSDERECAAAASLAAAGLPRLGQTHPCAQCP